MSEIKIYSFPDGKFILESTTSSNPDLKKYYIMNLDKENEENNRIRFVYPFNINSLEDFKMGSSYKELQPFDKNYKGLRFMARKLALEKWHAYYEQKNHEKNEGKISEVELENTLDAFRSFYADIIL